MSECGICMSTYTPPVKILSCGHSFCQVCLIQMRRQQSQQQQQQQAIDWDYYRRNPEQPLPAPPPMRITCPSCRSVTTLPRGRVSQLPTNFAIQNMISGEEGNQQSPAKTVADPTTVTQSPTAATVEQQSTQQRSPTDEFDVTPPPTPTAAPPTSGNAETPSKSVANVVFEFTVDPVPEQAPVPAASQSQQQPTIEIQPAHANIVDNAGQPPPKVAVTPLAVVNTATGSPTETNNPTPQPVPQMSSVQKVPAMRVERSEQSSGSLSAPRQPAPKTPNVQKVPAKLINHYQTMGPRVEHPQQLPPKTTTTDADLRSVYEYDGTPDTPRQMQRSEHFRSWSDDRSPKSSRSKSSVSKHSRSRSPSFRDSWSQRSPSPRSDNSLSERSPDKYSRRTLSPPSENSWSPRFEDSWSERSLDENSLSLRTVSPPSDRSLSDRSPSPNYNRRSRCSDYSYSDRSLGLMSSGNPSKRSPSSTSDEDSISEEDR